VSFNTLIGKTIGQYRIVSEIGRGGMAIVYKAEQVSLNRFVALKVLLPTYTGDTSSAERLQREARAAAGLDHPNIVNIYEVGEYEGLHYIAMKFIEGQPLDDILQAEGAIPADRAIRILAQVASALDYAHRRNLVHRDIKPSNIIVGPGDRVTLTDFGLVKATGTETLTNSGALVGTPAYMSPEQARGVELDYRADIYSLGVVCYEMLTGRPPFQGNPLSIILAHASQDPPPLRSFRPEIAPATEAVVLRALAKEPKDRFATAGEFIATLRQTLLRPSGDNIAMPASSAATSAGAPARKMSRGWIFVAVVLALLALLAVVYLGLGNARIGRLLRARFVPTPAVVAASSTDTPTPAATSAAASPTLASPTPSATATLALPTATTSGAVVAVDTNTPAATATATSAPSPTATAIPPTASPTSAPTATATVAPTATATPAPAATRPASPPAPIVLLGPADGQSFQPSDVPTLSWSWAGALGPAEQFVVVIDRVPPPPNTGVWHDYQLTRGLSISVPVYIGQTTADGRLEWYVQVMRSPRVDAGVLSGALVGQPSARRTFYWKASAPSGGPGPQPTPTRD
jgi:predicted Ser/Thr protein kinase